MSFNVTKKRGKRIWKILGIVFLVFLLAGIGATIYARQWYENNLQPVSSEASTVNFTIEPGESTAAIAARLESEGLIRNSYAFETYMRTKDPDASLKAGVFELSPSMSVTEIADILISGQEASELITIPPGSRLDEIGEILADAGFTKNEVDRALSPVTYAGHPVLISKPETANLEGYIYPESFSITASSRAQDVVERSLDELEKLLTPDLVSALNEKGLSIHEGIILASIIEREVPAVNDRKIVAQIFLKRLREGIELGSDATFYYAARTFGGEPFPTLDSPYNTRIYTGLPPGPIGNFSKSSIEAVAYPANTDYLYFVSGDDGVNHFTNTLEEHEAATAQYCTILCAEGYVPEDY